jgi:histidinol-phosphate aminotransferase
MLDIFRPELVKSNAYNVPPLVEGIIKLDAMENPYAFPEKLKPLWLDRLQQADLNRYPNGTHEQLVDLIHKKLDISDSHNILLGNGSDEIISMISTSLPIGSSVFIPTPTFSMYQISALFAHLQVERCPLDSNFEISRSLWFDQLNRSEPSLIWLSYPNNPTGNLFDESLIEETLTRFPHTLVVLDEAYHPFAKKTWASRLNDFKNMLVLRTLSKLGLAGIRLGYLAGHVDLMTQINKVRPPYNVNTLTAITAELALENYHLFEEQTERMVVDRDLLYQRLNQISALRVFSSQANFILFRVNDKNPQKASLLADYLYDHHIVIKNLSHLDGLHNCLRVSIGTSQENDYFYQTLVSGLATLAVSA